MLNLARIFLKHHAVGTGTALLLLCVLFCSVAHAQVTTGTTSGGIVYASYSGTAVTITGYTGIGGNLSLPDTINSVPVTAIASNAFANGTNLTGITVPNSVTTIGANAFAGQYRISTITIGTGVASIGSDAFAGVSELSAAYFLGNAPSGDATVFSSDPNATAYYFPATTGWDATFGGISTQLLPYDYTVASNQITITQYTGTGGAVAIPSTMLGMQVISIGNNAFKNKTALTAVQIPSSITTIGTQAFEGCTGLIGGYFLGNAPTGDSSVFSGDMNATAFYQPNMTGWGSTFGGITAAQFPYIIAIGSNQVTIDRYTGSGTAVSIPSTINGLPVTTLSSAFYDDATLASVTIPTSVTTIGGDSFYNCTGLTGITIPSSVTSIGGYAFYGTGLAAISIPGNVTSIGTQAFSDCNSLATVTMATGVTTIGSEAFYDDINLASVTIPGSVTTIGDSAFASDQKLNNVTLPNSVTSMGLDLFFDDTSLTNVTLPSGLTALPADTFDYCSGLVSVTIPSGVTSIGANAFEYTALTSIVIPNGVTSIGDYAFNSCSDLTGIVIPNSVTSIGNYTFYGCSRLASLTLSDNLTTTGSYAFSLDGKLTSVTIPASVTSLGGYAFYLTKVTAAYFDGNAPTMGSGVFSSVGSGFTVYYSDVATGFTSPTWDTYPAAKMPFPTTPGGLVTSSGTAQIVLNWSATPNSLSYQLQRSTTSSNGYSTIATVTSGTSYTDNDPTLVPGQNYYYEIASANLSGTSAYSLPVNGALALPVPAMDRRGLALLALLLIVTAQRHARRWGTKSAL